jgi:secreted PhoX family phosphatase
MSTVDRRDFLRRAVSIAGGAAIPGSVSGLVAACTEGSADRPRTSALVGALPGAGGYGDLIEDAGAVQLPEGFRMTTFGVAGQPMSDGAISPIAPDGMAAFPWHGARIRLVRNQEDHNAPGAVLLSRVNAYDLLAGGGATILEVDVRVGGDEFGGDRLPYPAVTMIKSFVALSGTLANCAGGPTPWHSWLSCEETVSGVSEGFSRPHGWVFEVPASAEGPVVPIPLKAMGRFRHEAVAVDVRTGIVYETEDHAFPPGSGFYRFLPTEAGRLERGGTLQMLKVKGSPRLQIFRGSGIGIGVGDSFAVEWVDIPVADPDPADRMTPADRLAAVFLQGYEQGGAIFNRLEGCWYGDAGVYFHDTQGGAARCGQVWRYVPGDTGGRLVLVFESPGPSVLHGPDNITVSPRGGLVLCEDSGPVQHLRGLTRRGEIFPLARNTLNTTEFAGATFSPFGQFLFVNIQGATTGFAQETGADPARRGLTMAITGPWHRGAL